MTGPVNEQEPRKSVITKVTEGYNLNFLFRALFGVPACLIGAGMILYSFYINKGHLELLTVIVGLTFVVGGAGVLNMKALREFGDFAQNIIPTLRGK